MNRCCLLVSLFFISCGARHEADLFDKSYANLCEAFTDLTKYAQSIHVNAKSRDYNDIRAKSSQTYANELGYEASLGPIEDCEDIQSMVKSMPKKTQKEIYYGELQAYMQELDPHSVYIPPAAVARLKNDDKNVSYGTGIEYNYVPRVVKLALPIESLIVDYIYPDTPAYRKISAKDEIEAIDGQEIYGKSFQDINALVLKTPDVIEFKVKRLSQSVSVPLLSFQKPTFYPMTLDAEKHYSMIRVPRFVSGLSSDLKEKLSKDSSDGLVIDLRGNPGGLVSEAASFLKLFVTGNENLFFTGPTSDQPRYSYSVSGEATYKKPIVLLVDSDTASSAEIVTDVMKQRHRAVVIGSTTFGKGSVQVDEDVSEKNGFGGLLITTIAIVFYQNYPSHQFTGIQPNFSFENPRIADAVTVLKEKNLSTIMHESDYKNPIHNDLAPQSNQNSVESPTENCDLNNYESCIRNYAIQVLAKMNSSHVQ